MTNLRALPPALLAAVAIVLVGALGIALLFVLNTGPLASPGSPTARPPEPASVTPGPRATNTAATGVPSTPEPQASLTAPPSPAVTVAPDQGFLLHVPEAIRPTCTLEGAQGNVIQTANCTADDGALLIAYSEYDTPESLASTFTDLRLGVQIEPDSGRCEDSATWPAEGVYMVGGEVVGRRLCLDGRTGPTIFWTDTRLNVLAQLVGPSGAYDRLVEFWTNEAGPVP